MQALHFLQKTLPKQTALLKAECADFRVREELGYELSGEGEFVALYVRKTDCNTLFVGEKLAQFAGISARHMSYAGLKDRKAVTEQWFCLHLPGKDTPDFSQFQLEGVEILTISRHNRKIRIGSLAGNYFDILLRHALDTPELQQRLHRLQQHGFPNYFTEQRFGRDGHNLTQALRWAAGEIEVKDRKKRSFYLSAARSEIFNRVVSERLAQGLAHTVQQGDIVQLNGSQSWFQVGPEEDLAALQARLDNQDIVLTAPLIGENWQNSTALFEQALLAEYGQLAALLKKEGLKTARRPLLMRTQDFVWQFEPAGLRLRFFLPAGSYATALVRELVRLEDDECGEPR